MLTEERIRPRSAVVDSSVSLKWILDDEECVDQAIALRDTAIEGLVEVVAPSLWIFEVTNGLVVATRRGRLSDDESTRSVDLLQRIGVRLADPDR
ncbi:MAG: type II toxin-antitoxin system VapC family toxin [Chloroflexota bacterium]